MSRARRMMIWVAIALVVGVALYSAGQAVMMARVAEPAFDVTERDGNVEIRVYKPMIVAEVETTGDRATAINAGFRLLAGYIFGGNAPNTKIAMTTPVTQTPAGQKIAMTAPVIQTPTTGSANGRWTVQFVMPENYRIDTLPKPDDPRVRLVEIPGRRVAAIRFSGLSSESNLSAHREQLLAFLTRRGLKTDAEPTFAFYNPPWTLPFLKRNEVMAVLRP